MLNLQCLFESKFSFYGLSSLTTFGIDESIHLLCILKHISMYDV
jgi:hypothetical protein